MEINREMAKRFVTGASILANLVLIGFLIFGAFQAHLRLNRPGDLLFSLLFLFPIANLLAIIFKSKETDVNTSKMSISIRELVKWSKSVFEKPIVQKFCFYSGIIFFASVCIYSITPKWQAAKEGNRVVSVNRFTGRTSDDQEEIDRLSQDNRSRRGTIKELEKQIADLKHPVDIDSSLYIAEIDDLKKQVASLRNLNADLNLTNHIETEHKK